MADNQVTTWKPDTCDCVISYSWDTSTTEDDRVHSSFCIGRPDRADAMAIDLAGICTSHYPLETNESFAPNAHALVRLDWHIKRTEPVMNVVITENQAKNRMKEEIKQAIRAENDEFDFSYTFEGVGASRSLIIASRDLPAQLKGAVRNAAARERISITVE